MKHKFLILLILILPLSVFGQKERKLVREGVKEYNGDQFSEAEVNFRKALDEKPGLYEADYNIANSLYKQKKYEESAAEYDKLLQTNTDPKKKADLYHNLGNAQVMAQQYDKGIEAYKNSLRIRPNDEDTRYNLAYALEKLKQQQQQQQQQQQDQKKDDKNQDKQDQDKQDQDKQNQDKQDQDKQKQPENQNAENKKEDQKSQEHKMTEQEAEQMLNAVQNQEKDVKEKIDKKKAVARPIPTEKDW